MFDMDLSEKLEEQKNRIDWCKWAGIKLAETDELLLLLLQEHEENRKLREQKRLIELPCSPDDTIYVIGTKCMFDEHLEEWCCNTDCNECIYDEEYIVVKKFARSTIIYDLAGLSKFPFYRWNDNTFATKEEAEEYLKLTKNKESHE